MENEALCDRRERTVKEMTPVDEDRREQGELVRVRAQRGQRRV